MKINASRALFDKIMWNLLSLITIATISTIHSASTNGEDLREWMEKHIQTELKPFNEISIIQLDQLEKSLIQKKLPHVRIKIFQGTVSYDTSHLSSLNLLFPPVNFYLSRVSSYIDFLKKMRETYSLPDTDFIIVLDDMFDESNLSEFNVPVFCESKSKSQTKIFAIPGAHLYPRMYEIYSKVNEYSSNFSWEHKIEIGFWRGSTTGNLLPYIYGYYDSNNWMSFQRTKFVLFAKSAPNMLDCLFSNPVKEQCSFEAEKIMRDRGLFTEYTAILDHIKYKYLFAIDGNTCASSLKWQLFSNSVVLKNDSDWMEWYDTALIPYKHYVPIKADFSDLIQKIEWLKQNDDFAQKIANEARLFAQENFTSSGVELYICKLLAAYSERLRP